MSENTSSRDHAPLAGSALDLAQKAIFRKLDRLPQNPRTAEGRIRLCELSRRLAEVSSDAYWVGHWERAIAFERCNPPAQNRPNGTDPGMTYPTSISKG